jgi:2,4-dichlorophenol 6-monooxygenase
MIFTLRREFQHADIDLGFEYADSPGVVPDGSEAPPRDPVGHEYVQVARPGHRMPHAWLERDGERIPTHDLVDPGAFLLLAGADGLPWRDAAERLSKQLEVPVHTYLVGPDGDLVDAEGVWEELRGHAPDGAILVRPDGHVAFRATSISGDVENELRGALEVALGFKAAASEALVTDR